MISIKLKYRKFFIPVKKEVFFPETWGECSGEQLLALLYSQTEGATDVQFLSLYTGLKPSFIKKLGNFYHLLLVEQAEKVSASFFDGIFCIKEIYCGNTKLLAPADRLKGVTFGQFIFIDAYFNDTDPSSRLKFIAHLYLPQGEKFNEDACNQRAAELSLPHATIEAIMYNYSLFYGYFQQAYPLLFQASHSGTKELSNSGTSKYDPRGWVKVFENVMGTDIINAEKYADVPLNTMFRRLSTQIKEQSKPTYKNPN
jgi:hypothetical protein